MAKFCGKCGSPLNESGMCPKCSPREVNDTEKTVSAETFFARQAYEPAQVAAPAPNAWQDAAIAPKKGFSKKPIIIAAAAAVVIGALAFCAFFFHWFGLGKSGGSGDSIITSQQQAYVKTSYGKISNKMNLNELAEEPKKVDELFVWSDDGETVNLFSSSLAQEGDTFYGGDGDQISKLVRITVTGKNSAKIEPWVSKEQLNNSVLGYKGTFAYDIGYFAVDGDYIYGSVVGDLDYFAIHPELNYRVFRIDKSGSKIEFVGDESVRAKEMIVKDGWIYYVDNGYSRNDTYSTNDYSRAGLYKIKTDGSGKTKLFGEYDESSDMNRVTEGCVGGLTLFGDKLYFMNLYDEKSLVCRMNPDGSSLETLSDRGARCFTIDSSENKLYYITGEYLHMSPNPEQLCVLDLDSKNNSVIYGKISSDNHISVDEGYVYFSTNMKEDRRIDVNSAAAQYVFYNDTRKLEYDDFGFEKVVGDGEQTYCWKEYDKQIL